MNQSKISIEERTMATVLKRIVEDKIQWIAARKVAQPLSSFEHRLMKSDRDFYQTLKNEDGIYILECKKASPSKGLIRADFDVQTIINCYQPYATAISVLTDEEHFQGQFEFLTIARNESTRPILCKDFIIDPYQIKLARLYGADAILLMLSILNDDEYQALREIAHQLGMGVLTEASNEEEVARAIALNAQVIGINNRDLRDLSVDLNRVKQLSQTIPADRIIISESGIDSHEKVKELAPYVDGFLIGSALMSESDLTYAVKKLIYGENKVCGLTCQESAYCCDKSGAVYGGLIFVNSSPRAVSVREAQIIQQNNQLRWVGVFRNPDRDELVRMAHRLNLTAVQLHGQESQQQITELREKLPANCQIWKAIQVESPFIAPKFNHVDRYVLDHGQGGTGQPFDWRMLEGKNLDGMMLAGGINLDNVKQAKNIPVDGLDINSGVESAPGQKDRKKIEALFKAIRSLAS